ncbi:MULTISPECIES: hypothetical protein [unclassified Streptomyces]|uniref:hypothetical protein n=1 Tax=unclassified Streptomyces TaxID=2593676 RepID=UPI003D744FEA
MRNALPTEDIDRASTDYRPDRAAWSGTEMLLAALKDEVRLLRMVTTAAHGGKPGEFEPTPRPGIPPKSARAGRNPLTDEQRRALDPRLRDQPQPKE